MDDGAVNYAEMISDEALGLPRDEYELWVKAQEDPPMPRPSEWPLGSNEGRCGFLESYIWFGEAALFEAVGHIWNSIEGPQKLRCAQIGMIAGTGGIGKAALANFLRRALREALDYEVTPPSWQEFPDIHQFHEATMQFFADSHAHYEKTVQKYADILNGEPGKHAPNAPGKLIVGPWH